MRLSKDKLASVIGYLSSFGADAVLFTPQGEFVNASVLTSGVYAEYMFEPASPLKERFMTFIEPLKDIAATMDDGDIVYRHGREVGAAGRALFHVEGAGRVADWRVPFLSLDNVKDRPEFVAEQGLKWDGEFADRLKLIRHAVMPHDSEGCLDHVLVSASASSESNSGRRVLVASDCKVMSVWNERTDVEAWSKVDGKETATVNFMLHRRDIAGIIETCESRMEADIRVGVSQYSVRCGRRTAIFGRRNSAMYPKSWQELYDGVRRMDSVGDVIVDRKEFARALRSVRSDDGRVTVHRHGNIKITNNSDGEQTLDGMRSIGRFGPVTIASEYLSDIASAWSVSDISIEYGGDGEPVRFTAPKEKRLMAIVMPCVTDENQGISTDETTNDEVATVQHAV